MTFLRNLFGLKNPRLRALRYCPVVIQDNKNRRQSYWSKTKLKITKKNIWKKNSIFIFFKS